MNKLNCFVVSLAFTASTFTKKKGNAKKIKKRVDKTSSPWYNKNTKRKGDGTMNYWLWLANMETFKANNGQYPSGTRYK